MKDGSFAVHGPKLFNELPRDLREYQGELETFKSRLDKWLATVTDKPSLPQYYQPAAGNNIIQQLDHVRAERAH